MLAWSVWRGYGNRIFWLYKRTSERGQVKYCQGPKCHTYRTKDRIRGPKGAKYYQTRRRSSFYYLGGNACSMNCERDWFAKFGDQAVTHFGRIHEPIKLTEENAWFKYRDWRHDNRYYFANQLSEQQIPIIEEQYHDDNLVRP